MLAQRITVGKIWRPTDAKKYISNNNSTSASKWLFSQPDFVMSRDNFQQFPHVAGGDMSGKERESLGSSLKTTIQQKYRIPHFSLIISVSHHCEKSSACFPLLFLILP